GTTVDIELLQREGFDSVVIATGVRPRMPAIPGIDHPKVVAYDAAILGAPLGRRVAVIGAGGVGFDVAEFLVQAHPSPSTDPQRWLAEWGVDLHYRHGGGLDTPHVEPPLRQVWLLQRTAGK